MHGGKGKRAAGEVGGGFALVQSQNKRIVGGEHQWIRGGYCAEGGTVAVKR